MEMIAEPRHGSDFLRNSSFDIIRIGCSDRDERSADCELAPRPVLKQCSVAPRCTPVLLLLREDGVRALDGALFSQLLMS